MKELRGGSRVFGTKRARRGLFVVGASARRLCLHWSGGHGAREEERRLLRAGLEERWWGVVRERLRMGRWRCGFGGWEAWLRWYGWRIIVWRARIAVFVYCLLYYPMFVPLVPAERYMPVGSIRAYSNHIGAAHTGASTPSSLMSAV
jgi:hypothetical protein